ncbi:MAG TPA: amino acid permease [Micromonosporaceae bacterium]|nr:amino acid permease [Micromonosporaceae bacterium]
MSTATMQSAGRQSALKREIGLGGLVQYGLIFMVPIAPFAIFGLVYSVSGGMPVLAYLGGLLALLFTAASYGQMVKAFPVAGSVYSYAGRSLGAPAGFLTGWTILLDYILVPSLLYLVAGIAMHALLPAVPIWAWILAFIVFNTVINLLGIRLTFGVIRIMIAAEMLVLLTFLSVGVWALWNGKGRGFSLAPLFTGETFSWPIVGAAVSLAVLSFLGFDAIPMLVEEAKGGAAAVGKALKIALVLAGLLFIAQVWVAGLLVPDPQGVIASGDPGGTAFYDAAAVAGGDWLYKLASGATAIAWGLADTLVAQVAVARLLYAMSRDRQLPAFLSRVSVKRAVPANATVFVAMFSAGVSLWMGWQTNGILLLSSMINMGAMIAFIVLHISVIAHFVFRKRSANLWSHLLVPLAGTAVLVYVVINARVLAQVVGFVWVGIGLLVLAGLYLAGRRPTIQSLPMATAATAGNRA